jgi:hypothetical protein
MVVASVPLIIARLGYFASPAFPGLFCWRASARKLFHDFVEGYPLA